MTTRVYVPTTLAGLADLVALAVIPATVDRYVADAADEEAEYDALMAAAAASALMLEGSGRRVVVVAEVDDPDGPVALDLVVAVHADPEDRPVDTDLDEDLAWFAAQEIEDLLGR